VNLTLIPLLIVALILATTDADVETAEVLLSGQHQIEDHRGALIVGDAEVTIPADAEAPGPIYVIGGDLTVAGAVATDVIQLAGSVRIEAGAKIGDELRLVGGTQSVASDADIGRRISFEINPAEGNPATGLAISVIVTLVLAWVGAGLTRRRRLLLENVRSAVINHYVVSLTVGTLLTLTALAVFVFMVSTLILIPIALAGIAAGVATIAYGIVSWGYIIGNQLPVRRSGWATALGVVATTVILRLAALVPLVGALLVFGVVLTAVGAIAITYYGVASVREPVVDLDT
jgi:hypothetical protein